MRIYGRYSKRCAHREAIGRSTRSCSCGAWALRKAESALAVGETSEVMDWQPLCASIVACRFLAPPAPAVARAAKCGTMHALRGVCANVLRSKPANLIRFHAGVRRAVAVGPPRSQRRVLRSVAGCACFEGPMNKPPIAVVSVALAIGGWCRCSRSMAVGDPAGAAGVRANPRASSVLRCIRIAAATSSCRGGLVSRCSRCFDQALPRRMTASWAAARAASHRLPRHHCRVGAGCKHRNQKLFGTP